MRSSSVLCDVIGCFTNIRFLPHCVFTCHSNSCLPATFSQGRGSIHQHCSAWLARELERGPRAFHTQTHSLHSAEHCITVCVWGTGTVWGQVVHLTAPMKSSAVNHLHHSDSLSYVLSCCLCWWCCSSFSLNRMTYASEFTLMFSFFPDVLASLCKWGSVTYFFGLLYLTKKFKCNFSPVHGAEVGLLCSECLCV